MWNTCTCADEGAGAVPHGLRTAFAAIENESDSSEWVHTHSAHVERDRSRQRWLSKQVARGRAQVGVEFESPVNERFEPLGGVVSVGFEHLRVSLAELAQDGVWHRQVVVVVRQRLHGELVRHDAGAPHVGAHVEHAVARLRSHVDDGARDVARLLRRRRVRHVARRAEVGELAPPLFGDQDVVRLNVAVHNAVAVQRTDAA
mmetsp:Transcript_18126/g.56237  ORF Transcript_18126/g.56237 Transcript_18126/m.56237 type:complete len:202 (-) Transcript_18126:639-1244(-)